MYRTPGTPQTLLVAFGENLLALEASTGRRLWQLPLFPMRFVMFQDRVIVTTGGLGQPAVVCVVLATGASLWKTPIAHTPETLLVTPTHIVVGGMGEVSCLDPSGRLLWHDGFKGLGTGKVALGLDGYVVQKDFDS
jgi:outer membrane protein assembly factor BamB